MSKQRPGNNKPKWNFPQGAVPKYDIGARIPPKAQLIISKERAARHQLTTAIELWAVYGDPISTHTLAVAAYDCYHALSTHRTRHAAPYKAWLERQSQEVQERITYAARFVKHGRMDMLSKCYLYTQDTNLRILDSIRCHEILNASSPILFQVWLLRYYIEHPDPWVTDAYKRFYSIDVDDLPRVDRPEFFDQVRPSLESRDDGKGVVGLPMLG